MLFFLLSVLILGISAVPLLFTLGGGVSARDRKQRLLRGSVYLGAGVVLVVILFILLEFLTEYFWFSSLNFSERFMTVLWTRLILFFIGVVFTALFLYINYSVIRSKLGYRKNGYGIYVILFAALLLGFWPASAWNEILLFVYQVRSPVTDPIFGRSVSFYLFSLPLYSALAGWFLVVLIAGYATVISVIAIKYSGKQNTFSIKQNSGIIGHFLFLTGLLSVLLAWYLYLRVFHLLYSTRTTVVGVGYTEANITIYGLYAAAAVFIIAAIVLFAGTFSISMRRRFLYNSLQGLSAKTFILPSTVIILLIVLLWLIPFLVQSLVVSPNEITLERPYLKNNIEFTRRGYSIDEQRVDQEFYPIGGSITTEVVENNLPTLRNVRLWDWRALLENLRQQQEIRLYYRFNDVDIDRYYLNGDYRQVMISVRELAKQDLDPRSRNWVSLRLKYTHGFGAVLIPANDLLAQGRPNLLIKNIPPESDLQDVVIEQPRIYYGELTNDHVYVATTEPEFDYPVGDEMVTNFYDGEGGVNIGPFWRKLLYALRFDDYRLLISGYFTSESRIMFRRNISKRAQALLPFLTFDQDPYPVITEDGRIVWIIDTYTTSSMYPYSQVYRGRLQQFHGINYLRNSVKVVIDAFNGTVEPYVVDTADVIISTYQRIFPDLLLGFDQMSENLKRHIRYPVDYFTVQSEMYTAYHMVNPETFYQREDLWEFATERYREQFQLVDPYYVMMEFPGQSSVEFALIVPFTPRNRNVMNAWMAGRSDMPNYGKLTVYPFPRGQQVFGPRQIEARIDQNAKMSESITLWGQRGSEVIRGNLLVIPLFHEDTLFVMYVEPLFIQAEDARIPELRRIIVADQNQVLWAETFEEAIELLAQRLGIQDDPDDPDEPAPDMPETVNVGRARALLQQMRNLAAEGNYSQAGERLEELVRILNPEQE